MKNGIKILALVVLAQLALTDAWAQDPTLPVTPGMYEITSTTQSNMSAEPNIKVMEVCINEKVFNPSGYLPSAVQCSMENVKKDGNKVDFDLACKQGKSTAEMPGAPAMTGKGVCSTTDSTLYCRFMMEGVIKDQKFLIDSVREGARTGECPDME